MGKIFKVLTESVRLFVFLRN